MKFLPASFRETQRDWIGKKGKSWHVTVECGDRGNHLKMATVEPSSLIETMCLNSNGIGVFCQVKNMLP